MLDMSFHHSKAPRPKEEFRGTVLIADDHALFRIGLVQLLRSDFRVKRFLQATSFKEGHRTSQAERCDALDLGPPDARYVEPQRHCANAAPASGRSSRSPERVRSPGGYPRSAISRRAWLHREKPTGRLIDRLRYILSGEIYVPPTLAEQANRGSRPEEQLLTSRQRQVLEGLVAGKSNKEIAQALNIAEGTVKMHLAALFRVLGATNRAHAAALGKQLIG